MIVKNEINVFNEEKARSLVNYLLEKDVRTYSKLLPEIQSLNSEEFHKLFNGEEYNYNVINKKDFKQLANKFDNFHKILDNYYEEDKYYPYIQDLWINNICIEDLGEDDYIITLKKCTIKYDEWPQDLKLKFKYLLKNTEGTRIYKLKQKFATQYSSYYKLVQNLMHLKQKFEYSPEDKGSAGFIDAAAKTLAAFILNLILEKAGDAFLNNIQGIHIESQKNMLLSQIKDNIRYYRNYDFEEVIGDKKLSCQAKDLYNKLLEKIASDGCEKNYFLDTNHRWVEDNGRSLFCLGEVDVKTKNGELIFEDPDLIDQLRYILQNELCSVVILAASVINLGWSIYNLNIINKEIKKLDELDDEFKRIQNNFYFHKKKLENLPDRIMDAINYINEITEDIEKDYVDLNNHINDIRERINKAKSIKLQSIAGMAISFGFGLLNIGGGILSIGKNVFNLVTNGISAGVNVFGGAQHFINYEKSKDLLDKLNDKLERAINFWKEMNKFIDDLVKKLRKKEKEIPTFKVFKNVEISENYC